MSETIELQNRVKNFNEELIPLLKKYRLGLGAQAFLLEDGRIGARPIIFDDTAPETTPAEIAPAEIVPEPTPESLKEA